MQFAIEDLGDLSPGLGCAGEGIDPSGLVVGNGNLPGFINHAIARDPDGRIRDLGTLSDPAFNSSAIDVNGTGHIVGVGIIDEEYTAHAFLLESGGEMTDLGTLADHSFVPKLREAGADERAALSLRQEWRSLLLRTTHTRLVRGPISSAEAINDVNQVVGFSTVASAWIHAFFFTRDEGMIDLGTLGGESSWAFDVNNSHCIVGSSQVADGASALSCTLGAVRCRKVTCYRLWAVPGVWPELSTSVGT
jgi:probable HAF family extracellular repeat protein